MIPPKHARHAGISFKNKSNTGSRRGSLEVRKEIKSKPIIIEDCPCRACNPFDSVDGNYGKPFGNNRRVIPSPAPKFFDNPIGLLSYKQAAQYLSVSQPYLRRLKSQGKIDFVIIGSRGIRFSIDSLKKWISEREIGYEEKT